MTSSTSDALSPFSHVTALKGVGAQLAQKLAKLEITHLQGLLFHLPRQYVDRTCITAIAELNHQQNAVIEAVIEHTCVSITKRRSLVCRIRDHSGSLSLRFYHFSNAQRTTLAQGAHIRCYGEVRRGASGLEIYHPEYQVFERDNPPLLEQTLTPVYPTTEGISQQRLRLLIQQTLQQMPEGCLENLLPASFFEQQQRPAPAHLLSALRYLHNPPKTAEVAQLNNGQHPYQQQLIYEELMAYQLGLLRLRQRRKQQTACALNVNPIWQQKFKQQLGFSLTDAQLRVIGEIEQDLASQQPMMRLLQGDVGSGKTVVAAFAALQAAGGGQVAIMAPTEILAEQHRVHFERWFTPLGLRVGSLMGKQKGSIKKQQLETLRLGETNIIIGTHALFQEAVVFKQLSLIIIDEQHRFGVHQRLSLRNKGQKNIPHQLIMTATPIPRTLAMSSYADLDYSAIDELPKGRTPVETVAISQRRRANVIERIYHACKQGRQAYWVCTLIESSETLSAQAAEETAALLQAQLPDICIGLVHGRQKASEKEAIMQRFHQGEIQLLVATTVIEVGVNVPNASLMVIENPERLGLAQLHQLRGRVGRGSIASHCVLLYAEALSLQGRQRLQALRKTNNGFEIANIDLEIRGPGEVLGTRQTGDIQFILAQLRRDLPLMPAIHTFAKAWLQTHPDAAQALMMRWVQHKARFADA